MKTLCLMLIIMCGVGIFCGGIILHFYPVMGTWTIVGFMVCTFLVMLVYIVFGDRKAGKERDAHLRWLARSTQDWDKRGPTEIRCNTLLRLLHGLRKGIEWEAKHYLSQARQTDLEDIRSAIIKVGDIKQLTKYSTHAVTHDHIRYLDSLYADMCPGHLFPEEPVLTTMIIN